MPDLYLNRVPSLPAIEDGSASHSLLGQAEVQVRSAAVKNTSELG